jgi:hypothetical protein
MQEMAEKGSPLLSRLAPAARERLFRGRAPRVTKPLALSDREPVEGLVVGDDDRCLRTVAEQVTADRHPLVVMRVLRRKSAHA